MIKKFFLYFFGFSLPLVYAQTSQEYSDKAYQRYLIESYPVAIKYYDKAIELDSLNEESFLWRGASKYYLKEYNYAIKDLTKSISISPDYADPYYYRGSSYSEVDSLKKALIDFNRFIELDPDNTKIADAYTIRGSIKKKLHDYSGAMNDIQYVIDHYPDYPDIYLNRGFLLASKGKYKEAILDYTKEINESQFQNSLTYYYRGMAKKSLNDLHGAIKDLTMAIKFDQDNPSYYYYRGKTYFNLEIFNKAQSDFIKVLDDMNSSSYTRINCLQYLGRIKSAELSFNEAIKYFNKALKIPPKSTDILYDRAISFFYLKKYTKAIADLELFLQDYPNSVNGSIMISYAKKYKNENNLNNYDLIVFYHDNGNIKTIGRTDVHKKNKGEWVHYFSDGNIDTIEDYSDDNGIAYSKIYYPAGQLLSDGKLKEDKQTGVWKYYHKNGKLSEKGEYLFGEKIGIWYYYNKVGEKFSNGAFKNKKKDGEWENYHANDLLRSQGSYSNGIKVNKWKYYYMLDGNLFKEGSFSKGKPNGKWTIYFNNGKIRQINFWKNGILKTSSYFDSNGKGVLSGDFTTLEKQDSQDSDIFNLISGGYVSNRIVDYDLNSSDNKYTQTVVNDFKSLLFFTEESIYFKRGNNDWISTNWVFEGFNTNDNCYYFYDNYNQKILISKDLKTIKWYYNIDGKVFKKLAVYENILKDEGVKL